MSSTPTLKRYTVLRRSSDRQKPAAADMESASTISCSSSISESSSGIQKDFDATHKSSGKKTSNYRIANTPKYVMAGLVDLVSRRRSPSASRRAEQRKSSEPITHASALPPSGRSPSTPNASVSTLERPICSPTAIKNTPSDPAPSSSASKPPLSPAQRRAPLHQNPVSPIVRVQYPQGAVVADAVLDSLTHTQFSSLAPGEPLTKMRKSSNAATSRRPLAYLPTFQQERKSVSSSVFLRRSR
uniref:Uncharacterized protein n=1 Tax=Steinernema glaseri TaxID=37863 RepID=A0A1I7YZG6_9BILA